MVSVITIGAKAKAAAHALRCAVTLGALVPAFFPSAAVAQVLQRLHVRTFTLGADRYAARAGEELHFTVAVHVDERVARIDNLALPDLSGFEVDGDERRCAPGGRGGTDCTEVLLVTSSTSGQWSIGPATLDAIDARNGRPSRFGSNRITVRILGKPILESDSAHDVERIALQAIVVAASAAVPILAALWLLRATRRRAPVPVAVVPPPPLAPTAPAVDPLDELVHRLREHPSRERVNQVRNELRRRLRAREEETLEDLLKRDSVRRNPSLADALRAVEHAAFVEDDRIVAAVGRALPPLERLTSFDPIGAGR